MPTRMRISFGQKPAMSVHRRILRKDKIVYLIVGPKPLRYKNGRSRIVYVGTTKKGADRIASSAANQAERILANRGLRTMDIHIVSCASRPVLKSWRYLESALLAAFLAIHLELPMCNRQGKKLRFNDKLQRMFKRTRVEEILAHFE